MRNQNNLKTFHVKGFSEIEPEKPCRKCGMPIQLGTLQGSTRRVAVDAVEPGDEFATRHRC